MLRGELGKIGEGGSFIACKRIDDMITSQRRGRLRYSNHH